MIVSASLLATLARHHRTVVLAVHVTECAQHLEAELSVQYPRDGQTDLACLRRRDTTIEVIMRGSDGGDSEKTRGHAPARSCCM